MVGLTQGRGRRRIEKEEEVVEEASGHCLHFCTDSGENSLLVESSQLTGKMEGKSSPPSLDLCWSATASWPKKNKEGIIPAEVPAPVPG